MGAETTWTRVEKTAEECAENLILYPQQIKAFFSWQRDNKRTKSTLERYQKDLEILYDWLPKDKALTRERLIEWKESMLRQGLSASTINTRLSAVNTFVAFEGRRDLQILDFMKSEKEETFLTRQEYIRLLQSARSLSNQRVYLIIKIFGTTGLPVQNLKDLTVESLQDGVVHVNQMEYKIPNCVQNELESYVIENQLKSGPIFLTRDGDILNRTTVTSLLKSLSRTAQVSSEKITPRCLKKCIMKPKRC